MSHLTKTIIILSAFAALLPRLSAAEMVKMENYDPQGPYIDTLRIERFQVKDGVGGLWNELSMWDWDFEWKSSVRSVEIWEDRPNLSYKVWVRDEEKTPLALIIPGIGAHFTNDNLAALAEVFYDDGYSVAVIGSVFNWEFIRAGSTAPTPGYAPDDAKDIYNALIKIVDEMKRIYGDKFGRKVLTGYSLGAQHALFIADLDAKDNRIGFDRVVAINPPVDLLKGMRKIDEMSRIWRQWRAMGELHPEIHDAAGAYMMLRERELPIDAPIPMNSDQAEFLIGFAFRQSLKEALFAIHRYRDQNKLTEDYSWFVRDDLYREIERVNFQDYLNRFLLPYYRKQGQDLSLDKMAANSNLRAVESLRTNSKVRVLHNINDFLLDDEDRQWLIETLGDRLTLFEQGGHLGNMYLETFQNHALWAADPNRSRGNPKDKRPGND